MVTAAATKEPIFSRSFTLAVVAQHCYFAAFYSMITALPLFLGDLPGSEVGIIIGSMGITSLLIGPFPGYLADRLGRRNMAVFGGATTALAFALQGLSHNVLILVAVRLFHGAVMQIFATANSTLTADLAPATRRGEAMGFASVSNTLAQIYAPWAGLFIATRVGFPAYWTVATALVVASTTVSLTVPDHYRRGPGPTKFFSASALLPLVVFIGFATGFSVLSTFLTRWSLLGLGNAGLWFFIFGLSMLFSRVNAGRLADRIGRVRVVVPAGLICASGLFLLSIGAPWAFYLAPIGIGIGFAAAHTSLTAFTIDRAPPAERGAAIGVFFLGWGVGQIIAGYVLGPLASGSTFPLVFALAGCCVLAGLPLLILNGRRTKEPQRPPVPVHFAGTRTAIPATATAAARPSLFAAAIVAGWAFLMAYLTWFSWLRGARRKEHTR